ncbi:hypothetical protein [Nesterenkonia muleiensis]|uniref:hypothetical protein n=1 Tax=Nesterenkonia muleiensis TaxID=2282648 RepID=UPI000E75ECB1|nr:hypothetical protein [Nesterenkonia muleiensis]
MPDKPLETSWLGTRVFPTARRARRAGRKLGRAARSRLAPQVGAVGAVPLNASAVGLTGPSGRARLRRCDVIVVGVPERASIPGIWREALIAAEQHSIPTVLLVDSAADLNHPLAAVVTHLVTADQHLFSAVEGFAGAERSALLDQLGSSREQTAALLELTRTHTPVEKS